MALTQKSYQTTAVIPIHLECFLSLKREKLPVCHWPFWFPPLFHAKSHNQTKASIPGNREVQIIISSMIITHRYLNYYKTRSTLTELITKMGREFHNLIVEGE